MFTFTFFCLQGKKFLEKFHTQKLGKLRYVLVYSLH